MVCFFDWYPISMSDQDTPNIYQRLVFIHPNLKFPSHRKFWFKSIFRENCNYCYKCPEANDTKSQYVMWFSISRSNLWVSAFLYSNQTLRFRTVRENQITHGFSIGPGSQKCQVLVCQNIKYKCFIVVDKTSELNRKSSSDEPSELNISFFMVPFCCYMLSSTVKCIRSFTVVACSFRRTK